MKKPFCLLLIACLTPAFAGEEESKLAQEFMKSPSPARAIALAQRGETALPYLIQGLEKGGRVAAHAAVALWHHPQPGAAPALRDRLLKVDQVAGYYAARALGKMPSDENVAALAALLPNEPKGFWELSSGGVGRLTDAWDDKGRRYNAPAPAHMANLRVAYAAMEALGELGGEAATAALLRALENDQYLIRYAAARGLGRMQAKETEARLAELAGKDPVLIVRLAARQALAVLHRTDGVEKLILSSSPIWLPPNEGESATQTAPLNLPPSIAFLKTRNRSDATLGFRDSYFFPKTPRYHSGENLYTLTPPRPDGVLKNLTQLTEGEVQGPEVSYDGTKILFSMRRNRNTDGFHIFEINIDGTGLRQITSGNCNDVDPAYLPDGRIVFCSDRAGYQEYYHQERSRVIYVMNADGTGIQQITFNPNQDYEPLVLSDGRVSYSSYRFYAQDGSEGPLRGEFMGLARIETVLRSCNPDGSADDLLYGSMRGEFFSPMRPMPFSDQFAGWHKRGFHVGVSVSQQRELPNGNLICTTPAGLTLVDMNLVPLDCEIPLYPEVVNLAGGEEVYIHNYDDKNPVGRYTTPFPLDNHWVLVSHAPWNDLRENGYGLYAMNLATRELRLIYDDPQMSDVDPIALVPQPRPLPRASTLATGGPDTGRILCNSVFNSDIPFDREAVKYVRVLEAVQMGQSIAANAAFRTRILGTAPLHPDGSFYVEVPADVPLRFELLDKDGQMLVHETEFNYVRKGEVKGCVGCHENRRDVSPNSRPMALNFEPFKALRQRGDLIYFGRRDRPYNNIYRD
jgi:HEAT repeat protein